MPDLYKYKKIYFNFYDFLLSQQVLQTSFTSSVLEQRINKIWMFIELQHFLELGQKLKARLSIAHNDEDANLQL